MRGPLTVPLRKFVRFKQRLGFKYTNIERSLKPINRWLAGLGVRSVREVTGEHLVDWCKLRQGRVSRSTLSHDLVYLRLLFRFLVSRGVVDRDPTLGLPTIRLPQYLPFVFSVEQVRALLTEGIKVFRKSWTQLRNYVFFHLLYATGMRLSEALNLKIGDLDLTRCVLHIRRAKFHKTRLIPFGPRVLDNLRRLLFSRAWRRDHRKPPLPVPPLAQTDAYGGRPPVVFKETQLLKRDARRYLFSSPTTYRRCTIWAAEHAFRRMRQRTGLLIPRRDVGSRVYGQPRIHCLRHAFAVHRLLKWYREGQDVNHKLLLLSTYMGHSQVAFTQVYLNFYDTVLAEAGRQFGDFLDREGAR